MTINKKQAHPYNLWSANPILIGKDKKGTTEQGPRLVSVNHRPVLENYNSHIL